MGNSRPPTRDGPPLSTLQATDADKERYSASSAAYNGEHDTEKTATPISNDIDDSIYDRFSVGRKRAIVAVVSFAALLARVCFDVNHRTYSSSLLTFVTTAFATASFLPSIPQISTDLGVSHSVIK
jgi:hypothetical protein